VFVGRVEARHLAELGFERAGRLVEVRVREGEAVPAGALLARLDPSLLQATRVERSAELANAEAELALAEATAKRYRDSIKEGAVTRQGLDEAREGARAASAKLRLAKARIASIDLDLTKTELRAPFAGTLVRRRADEGTVLAVGQPVLTLQEAVAPQVRVGVAGPLIGALRPGDTHCLELSDKTFAARLRAIIPLRTGNSRTFDALFEPLFDKGVGVADAKPPPLALLEPAPAQGASQAQRGAQGAAHDGRACEPVDAAWLARLRPGDLVELRLQKSIAAKGFWLPLSALSEGNRGLWRVLVAEPEASGAQGEGSLADTPYPLWRLVSRTVQVLHSDGERAFIRGALQPGERVVAAGLHRLVPGQRVRIIEAASPSPNGLD
jgi:multidrug efflux pump subunit AcrA (membrane-fusion protein)